MFKYVFILHYLFIKKIKTLKLILKLMFFLTMANVFFNLISYIGYKYIYKYVFIYIFFYCIISIFIYLNKYYSYNKYTSQIQRFWKRSYIIFWLLEFFTFSIFMFLTLTHFSESIYFLDWEALKIYSFNNITNFLFNFFTIVTLLFLNYFLLFFKKFNNNTMINIVLLMMLLILSIVLYYEFSKFFYVLNYYPDTEKTIFLKTKKYTFYFFNENEINKKTRTLYHYLHLFVILKFWHIFFIFIFFIFFLKKYENFNTLSYDFISANYSNYLYLFWFNMLFYLFFFKFIILSFSQYTYYWFFVNLNFVNFIQNVILEFKLLYFF